MRAMRPGRLLLPFVLSIVACGPGERSPAASAEVSDLASPNSMAGGNKMIGVMSRNLYLGADLGPVIGSTSPAQFAKAAAGVWAMVQKNDFHVRAHAIAAEIAQRRPALVGLQEAFTWRMQSPPDVTQATQIAYDYVPEIIAALASRGLVYRQVAEVELLDFEAPTALDGSGVDVRLTDHGAILAREDVHTSNAAGVVFANLLPLNVLGQTVFVKRGYVAVDVKYRGQDLRFVSTHLESFHPGIRALQALELAGVVAAEKRPVILVGDLNSHPGVATDGEGILLGAGLRDVWGALHPSDPGLTCCFLEDLTKTAGASLSERIDYVLTRGPFEPRSAVVLGADRSSRMGGLWPSDHAGVFAEVRIADDPHDR
jgi:hypothetical protein